MINFVKRCPGYRGNVFFYIPLMLLLAGSLSAQTAIDTLYDTDHLPPSFHKGRRSELLKFVSDSGMVMMFSSYQKVRSNDVDYSFSQDRNFYYFTGYNEPNGALLLFKKKQEFDSVITNDVLVINEKNPSKEVWTGKILGIEGAKAKLGPGHVIENKKLADLDIDWKSIDTVYYLPIPDSYPDDKMNKGDVVSMYKLLVSEIERNKVKSNMRDLPERFAYLRQTKTPEEIILLKKAIDASILAHYEVMRMISPGMSEFDGQAVFEYVTHSTGCEDVGYPSIVGAGHNSCVLHYSTNRKKLVSGDLMVIDAGGEYHYYTADVTRTLPVNGKFTKEQKVIYDIVLEAQEAGIKASVAGNKFWEPNKEATNVIARRLIELGIIKTSMEVRKYFMHGTSHYLGLDVHDAGLYGPLQPGHVITVEPGIYIPEGSDCDPKWWNIGVRIEDDILITSKGPENLSGSLPRKTDEIEKIMQEPPTYFKNKGQHLR